MAVINEVRRGFYLDSVALMRNSRAIGEMTGVIEAAMMMGTPSNMQIMSDAHLLQETGEVVSGGDLVIAIRAESTGCAEEALQEARDLLEDSYTGGGEHQDWHPRTFRSAIKSAPQSNLALISVPGDFAVSEARKAIRHGLHAMIFSDNVDLAEEAELKKEARELGCLVMGPDCGTAIINGVPLAFANVVPRGDIGIVGASGTGIQEVSCLIAQHGGGISQAIGVGGRDLNESVGGISTLVALDALTDDTLTRHIVVISKPPPASVAKAVIDRIAVSGKDFTVCFLGAGDLSLPENARSATTLKQAAESALGDVEISRKFDSPGLIESAPENGPRVLGLFSGGSLCAEAQVVFRAAGEPVVSNAPLPGVPLPADAGDAHCMLDLGDDQYTRGRPHPMIDPAVRDDAIIQALNDADAGAVLLDLVIGYGAHTDPAGHLAGLIAGERPLKSPVIIASVTGTEADPQVRSTQIRVLEASGILVESSNADAAALALEHIRKGR